jgi:outer membrane lipoprotein carrier protein
MKRIFAGMMFLLLPMAMMAQSDPNAVKLLKSVSQKYGAYKTMSMDISLQIDNLETKKKEERKGKVLIKGNKFNLDMEKQLIQCDGKTIWTYLKDVNEVQVNTFNPKEEMITPDKIFKLAEKDYLSVMGDKYTTGGKNIQVVELTPNDKSLGYSKIKLHVNTADNSVMKGVVYDKSAVHYTYSISNFKSNAEIADSKFSFNKADHAGVDVIDLRE